MKVTAKLENLRMSPRKVRLVTDLIKGMDANGAVSQLEATIKGASQPVRKLLQSAMANGENNEGIDKENMYVFDITVGAGATLKRWRARAFGRAGRILKRTSVVKIVLEERVEGKNRKTRDQLEKEKKERISKKKKEEKEILAKEKEKNDELKKNPFAEQPEKESEAKKTGKEAGKAGWTNKIFRRKSM